MFYHLDSTICYFLDRKIMFEDLLFQDLIL